MAAAYSPMIADGTGFLHARGVSARGDHGPDEAVMPTGAAAPTFMLDDPAIPIAHHFGDAYNLLERQRPDVVSLARFARSVELATFHMCVAFEQAGVHDFEIDTERRLYQQSGNTTWFLSLADTTFCRFRTLRRALMYNWTPPAEVEPLTYSAFHNLCDLTPATGHYLKQLFVRRRPKAIEALVGQLDLIVNLLEDAVKFAAHVEPALHDHSATAAATQLAANQSEILAKAGEPLGLRKAAEQLGMSHQNLHKRIGTGSALGVMRGRELIVPSIQFVEDGLNRKVVPELRKVLALFDEARAGSWSALQFLIEVDPVLGAIPIEALKAGRVDAVVHSARAYLALDES